MSFSNVERIIPCFTPGTRIDTARGEVPVEEIVVGDLVLTRDNGYRPIRWVGRRDLSAAELVVRPELCPVLIRAGALGHNEPNQDMMVSPQHRFLFAGGWIELLTGESEVLVAALHLTGRLGIERLTARPVSYIHLLFDAHEIVLSDGTWSESFQPGRATLGSMDDLQRREIFALFPELDASPSFVAARPSAKGFEARAARRAASGLTNWRRTTNRSREFSLVSS